MALWNLRKYTAAFYTLLLEGKSKTQFTIKERTRSWTSPYRRSSWTCCQPLLRATFVSTKRYCNTNSPICERQALSHGGKCFVCSITSSINVYLHITLKKTYKSRHEIVEDDLRISRASLNSHSKIYCFFRRRSIVLSRRWYPVNHLQQGLPYSPMQNNAQFREGTAFSFKVDKFLPLLQIIVPYLGTQANTSNRNDHPPLTYCQDTKEYLYFFDLAHEAVENSQCIIQRGSEHAIERMINYAS